MIVLKKITEPSEPPAKSEMEYLFQDYKRLIESGDESAILEARKKIQLERERLDKK
jgi:hypothetical protein